MIVFDLSEHRFYINRPLFSVFYALFGIEFFLRFLLVFSELMISFCYSVALTVMAYAAHRAAMTISCLITADGLFIARSSYPGAFAYILHLLAHRANQVISLLIIV